MGTMVTSKITERSQTTVPPAVRTVLGLKAGERVGYVIEGTEVRLVNASAMEHEDPLLEGFLAFLARDVQDHPGRLVTLPPELVSHLRELTRDVAIDHDEPIDGAVAL